MVKDRILRLLFIPVLGLGISYMSGIITYNKYNTAGKTGAGIYFIFISYCIWRGCQWIHIKMRGFYSENQRILSKLFSISGISALYGCAVAGIGGLLWMRFSAETFRWSVLNKFILASVLAVILFTLVYEVLFLNTEIERDNQIVDQLDHELSQAEMMALRKELDPHFIFNSLTTLSQLITHDEKKAFQFNMKLAEVYKYFVVNRNKEVVPLQNEIDFINNYYYLLQIRFAGKLNLTLSLNNLGAGILVVPSALQLLLENAIKHNRFSKEQPLEISIQVNPDYITVQNNLIPQSPFVPSTGVGLRNLNAQYLILCKKHIVTEKHEHQFIVKLPVITDKTIRA